MADILKSGSFEPNAEAIVAAALVLKAGGLVVIPTDTVYCLAADMGNEQTIKRFYELKGRIAEKGLPVLINDISQLTGLTAQIPPEIAILTDFYWPGPLTLVFKKNESVQDIVTGGLPSVAVRLPGGVNCLAILEEFGGPLASSSANISGGPAPMSAAEIDPIILEGADLVIDSGICPDGIPSTIVDVSGPVWRLLREGRITKEAIEAAVGRVLK
jgi:L-threonylcarbamoyladenylate synthase